MGTQTLGDVCMQMPACTISPGLSSLWPRPITTNADGRRALSISLALSRLVIRTRQRLSRVCLQRVSARGLTLEQNCSESPINAHSLRRFFREVAKDRDTDKLIEEKYVSEQSKYTVVRGNKMTQWHRLAAEREVLGLNFGRAPIFFLSVRERLANLSKCDRCIGFSHYQLAIHDYRIMICDGFFSDSVIDDGILLVNPFHS